MDVYELDSQETSPPKPFRIRGKTDIQQDPCLNKENLNGEEQGPPPSLTCPPGHTTIYKKVGEVVSESCHQSQADGESVKEKGCRVGYVFSPELIRLCDAMPKIAQRASMVHSLIEGYGLMKYMQIIVPKRASEEEMLSFHSTDYIQFLRELSLHDDEEKFDEEASQYGLSYDCPLHQGLYDYGALTGGATITAAESLLQNKCQIALNWCGGWHHAKKDSASGFCYINDIVLGIHKLREKFNHVLYLDLDVHHGDGVEDAFCVTTKVMTVSVHKYAAGFFPGTGSLNDKGVGKAKYHTVNIPLRDGVRDMEFVSLLCRVLQKVQEVFRLEAVVCQCGADGLAGDPMDSFNLTHMALGRVVYFLLGWKLPTLLLGGGGYHNPNTSRCWAYLTSIAVNKKLPTDIPDNKYFTEYGPDYELMVMPGNRKDHNTKDHYRSVYQNIIENLGHIS